MSHGRDGISRSAVQKANLRDQSGEIVVFFRNDVVGGEEPLQQFLDGLRPRRVPLLSPYGRKAVSGDDQAGAGSVAELHDSAPVRSWMLRTSRLR